MSDVHDPQVHVQVAFLGLSYRELRDVAAVDLVNVWGGLFEEVLEGAPTSINLLEIRSTDMKPRNVPNLLPAFKTRS